MTITIHTANPAATHIRLPRAAHNAVEIWDIPTEVRGHAPCGPVRSIQAATRTFERPTPGPVSEQSREFERGGVRQEVRAGVLLGAFAGCALLLGSSLGGVFTDGNTHIPSDVTREVVQAEIR